MATLTIQDLPDPVRQALSDRADRNGRSLDAEVREILEKAAGRPTKRETGAVLVEIGKTMALTEGEAAIFASVRDKSPMRAAQFDDPA